MKISKKILASMVLIAVLSAGITYVVCQQIFLRTYPVNGTISPVGCARLMWDGAHEVQNLTFNVEQGTTLFLGEFMIINEGSSAIKWMWNTTAPEGLTVTNVYAAGYVFEPNIWYGVSSPADTLAPHQMANYPLDLQFHVSDTYTLGAYSFNICIYSAPAS